MIDGPVVIQEASFFCLGCGVFWVSVLTVIFYVGLTKLTGTK